MAQNAGSKRPYWVKWYKTAAWLRLREWQLKHNPLCAFCERDGRITPADTVDHIKPHKGDKTLFFNRENLQSLCKTCHSSDKQLIEHGKTKGCDEKGMVGAWQEKSGSEATT